MLKRIVLAILVLAFIGLLLPRDEEQPTPPTTANPVQPTPERPELLLRGIESGFLRTQLEPRGLKCEGPRKNTTRVSWLCADDNYRVEFMGQSPTRIDYVTGTAFLTSPTAATQLFTFLASLPYEGSNPDAAQAWVRSETDFDGETVIGGVKIRLVGPERAPSISLFPVGSDWDG